MNIQMLRGALLFAVLLLVQVLVFNHIHLFNCATPLLYIYVALLFPRDIPRWAALVSCFIMGFLVDMFSNTPGVSMASLTFLGLIQPFVLNLFMQHDSADDLQPSMRSLGLGGSFTKPLSWYLFIAYCSSHLKLSIFSIGYSGSKALREA